VIREANDRPGGGISGCVQHDRFGARSGYTNLYGGSVELRMTFRVRRREFLSESWMRTVAPGVMWRSGAQGPSLLVYGRPGAT